MKKLFIVLLLIGSLSAFSQTNKLVIDTQKEGVEIPSTLYGIFFEDINFGADGGLYAEKIKNRSFDFPYALTGWTPFGNLEVKNDGPFENNPNYIRLSPPNHKDKYTGIDNEGFFGVSFQKDEEYRFSVWARVPDGGNAEIKVQLTHTATGRDSQDFGSTKILISGSDWNKYSAVLKARGTAKKGKLRIFLSKPENTVDLEHISLFPIETWNGHDNGLRKDLVEKLSDLKPGVFRFPGGCIVEGTDLDSRYQWKNTIGPVENRPLNENRWHYTFTDRFYPDYFQTNGLGFYEYFLLSEELGAEPLPVVNVGLSCQFQNTDPEAHAPLESLQPYIDDAIDLIEFANGDSDTKWGKIRTEMGHPSPFNLKYLALGNEQWGPEYSERLRPFVKAIREKHPEIKLIGSAGPFPEGEQYDYLWKEMKKLDLDLVDEHFYQNEDWFANNADRYDNFDRKGPKVFVGEFACHESGKKYNHFNEALWEAAFITGLERNADVIEMSTYAPLFAHVEGWQWRPDLIWFDNVSSVPTSSYYVQKLFAENKGTKTVPISLNGKNVTGKEGQNGLYATASKDEKTGDLILKVVNTSEDDQPIELDGLKSSSKYRRVKQTLLKGGGNKENSISNPNEITPEERILEIDRAANWTTILPKKSLAVYRFQP